MPHGHAEPQRAEIEARVQMAVARTAQDLSDSDLSMIRKQIARSLELRAGLRSVDLENYDEPEHGFDPAVMHTHGAPDQDRGR